METVTSAVARNLRALRAERGISVSELARKSGVAKGTVSKLERGVATNPTVETLWALADALGATLGDLVVTTPPMSQVVRADEFQWIEGNEIQARVIDQLSSRQVHDVSEVRFAPKRVREAGPHAEGAVAHVLVLEGRLRAGPPEAPLDLGPGDYARFSADRPHFYQASGKGARALVMVSLPRHPPTGPNGYIDGSLLAGVDAGASA